MPGVSDEKNADTYKICTNTLTQYDMRKNLYFQNKIELCYFNAFKTVCANVCQLNQVHGKHGK